MTRDGHQIGRFPLDMVGRIDEAIAEAGSTESRIQWVLAACEQRLRSEAESSLAEDTLAPVSRATAFRGRSAG